MSSLYSESVWALRNVRARGWRAVLAASLLAVALAANLLVFSTADSLVFHRVPYLEPERLVSVARQDPRYGEGGDAFLSPALLDEWRKQTGLFSGVHGYLGKTLFLTGGGEPDLVATADITPGLIELLGAAPPWGRSLDAADAREIDPQVVLISERLARRRFGNPAQAVGRHLETTDKPLLVVGVMPAYFRFPSGQHEIWRALDPRGPLTRNFGGVESIARLAPSVSIETATRVMAHRSPDVAQAAGRQLPYVAAPQPLRGPVNEERRTAFVVLLGASFLLLLITAANVVSLELASAFNRARVTAVQLVLGASNASLQRTALIEGLYIVILGFAGAVALSTAGLEAVVSALPERFTAYGANPIDLDRRAVAFTAAIAVAVWFASWLPTLFRTISSDYMTLLKTQGHTVTMVKTGARVRAGLTVAQVALAVVLLVGGVLYVRSYAQLVRLEKGFDSSGLAEVSMTLPPQVYPSAAEKTTLTRDVIDRIKSVPGVIAASAGSAPPSMGDSPTNSPLMIEERAPIEGVRIRRLWVAAEYFSVLRMPLKAGRYFEAGDPLTNVIVSETFAKRFWTSGNAVGSRFRIGDRSPWSTVVGVVGHVRIEPDGTSGPSTDTFQTYVLRPPPPPPPANANASIDNTGGSYAFIDVMVRLDSASRAGPVLQAVRAVDSRFRLKLEFVDDTYARQFDDRLMATQIIGVFAALAFTVAMAGIYGVMAFLVAQRTRELGIRVALGADRPAIRKLVLGGSLRLAAIGILFGIGASVAASRWVQSQLFGVSAVDPATFSMVAAVVLAAAVLATWQPLRQASRVDPVVALRSE